MMNIKTYSELITFNSFEERYNYLKLNGQVGSTTFGYDRYLNQILYKSREWKRIRDLVILRDKACDLGVEGHDIFDGRNIIVHHMNPITIEQIQNRDPMIFDPELLITTIHRTHNAIHYGDESLIAKGPIIRTVNDTCPWKG